MLDHRIMSHMLNHHASGSKKVLQHLPQDAQVKTQLHENKMS
jgi:hypothetical protein